jgi:hypothetical protein
MFDSKGATNEPVLPTRTPYTLRGRRGVLRDTMAVIEPQGP